MDTFKPQLAMLREELESLPELNLPEGYSVRGFQDGDEAAWERIIQDSFGGERKFDSHMRRDPEYRPERVRFICCHGEPVATASAWYSGEWGADTGCLHMVGILSSHAGKGIGSIVSLAAMHQMKREGRTRAVLRTDDFRIPAIKSYWKLGYKPYLVHENQVERWRAIGEKLGIPLSVQ
ncbi:GNAT family N-acetyltransferase [Paenibacillus hodogayensis]|uniref:GNAT family N-acetyltransferase n=1 Tax=Paenibacillus hodogayensis TaxID=279208 RepID=A0ABV5VYZ7_9BACL